jgi:hypothetical protein
MTPRRYLVGTKNEKQTIERLMFNNLPGNVSYEYAFLCNALIERLYEEEAVTSNDYDAALCGFLYELSTDVQERMKLWSDDFDKYIKDIEEVLTYFKGYLETIDCFPLPMSLDASEGTYGSVMMLTVRI